MKANLRCLVVVALLSGGAYAQVITEHAAAVAGATAGTAGGKVLSDVLDKALGKAANPEGDASAAKKPNNKPPPAVSATPGAAAQAAQPSPSGSTPGATTPVGTHKARVARPAPEPANPAFASAQQSLSAPTFALARPSTEDFEKVKEGGARQDVFAALGTPSSLITIPDEGHLIEIMTYSEGRRRLGSVRLDNGQVVSVSPAR